MSESAEGPSGFYTSFSYRKPSDKYFILLVVDDGSTQPGLVLRWSGHAAARRTDNRWATSVTGRPPGDGSGSRRRLDKREKRGKWNSTVGIRTAYHRGSWKSLGKAFILQCNAILTHRDSSEVVMGGADAGNDGCRVTA